MIKDLILKNRSFRRFDETHPIDKQTVIDLIDLARNSASGANLQPLKYYISNESELNAKIFPLLKWAGYLKDWSGPQAGERPTAYIVILGDSTISEKIDGDHGIAAQSILLGACERGLGGCIIGSIERKKLSELLDLPDHLKILLLIALGKPKENVVLREADQGDVRYWRDENNTHYVPKRPLKDIILNFESS